ncbi:adhesion G-protein coupled receptor G5 isoform X4 [Canis aureus]
MDPWGVFFLCLCFMTAQSETMEASQEPLHWMKKLERMVRSRSSISLPGLIRDLECSLLNASFGGSNLTLQTPNIQALIFKLGCNFAGLSLNSTTMKRVPQAWVPHAMQFPAELTQDACRTRPRELRLICIYFFTDHFFQNTNSSLLNNYVLGAQLGRGHVNNLRDPVNISFWHNRSLEGYTATCVFWKEGASKDYWGAWSSEGCRTEQPSPSQVLCRCNHLSYFAVLMQLSPAPIPEELLAPLTYISLVGCSISMVASLLTLLLHFQARQQGDSITRIHMNLHASVLLLNVTFLLSPSLALPSTSETAACKALAAIMHFALLSCLTWMAIEGFNLYLLLGRVYNIYIHRYLLKLCAVGWDAGCGTPGCTTSWSWATVASRLFSTWWCWSGRCGCCTSCGPGRRCRAPAPAGTASPCWASPCCWAPPGPWLSSPSVSSCCPSSSSSPPSTHSMVSSSSCGFAPRGTTRRRRPRLRWRRSAPPRP